jgi:hypothetical protein
MPRKGFPFKKNVIQITFAKEKQPMLKKQKINKGEIR